MNSLLCDFASEINSEPLTYFNEEPDDLIPLALIMLFKDNLKIETLDFDNLNKIVSWLQKIWLVVSRLRKGGSERPAKCYKKSRICCAEAEENWSWNAQSDTGDEKG
ncbi:hypothetical protein NPIL_367451 [Nephila pilipes]|uniref:Uncharacterized protein n=1 Tax=Nephila pilipes TaxID=299642 RepID=A0A8X6P3D9_NEPPI|nr:hypothetical protein NPIL_367451 [Nephila pilipes]